jgi:Tol biopolymer transport system component
MNTQMLRNPYGALGLVAVTVAASLVATGCREESGADIPTVGGSTAAATTTTSDAPWIAYSTAHVDDWRYNAGYGRHGSDVYMTRAGDQPKLVASRGRDDAIWNVCPAFSPDGRLLAFVRVAPSGSAIVVVRVARDGTTGAPRVVVKMSAPRAPCPRWSSDSSRVAYLDRSGTVVVRGLDGSTQHGRDGDPRARDFIRSKHAVSSPTGRLIATLSNGTIIVSRRPHGSDRRVINDHPPSYAIGGWSPDGRKLLIMRDVGGGSMIRAVSVVPPFVSTTVVAYVSVNNERSWPGYGDVSWQPMRHP